MDKSVHYLTYDPEEIYKQLHYAHIDAGGDVLYFGDEKEMLVRAMQMGLVQMLAAADNALRMATLRYAVHDYLDLLGETRDCPRIQAKPARAIVEIKFRATGKAGVLKKDTPMTADGSHLYMLDEDITQTGYAQTIRAGVTANDLGSVGNGLISGTQMQFLISFASVESVYCVEDAAGGQEREEDEAYRERIRTHGLANLTTGPAIQYEAIAKSVTSEIKDAQAVNLGPGKVGVFLLLESGTGAAAIIKSVKEALNGQQTRPMTDEVQVFQAADIPYSLHVMYKPESGSNISGALSDVVSEYRSWQDETIGRAFNPDRLMAHIYQAGAVRVYFGEDSQFDGGPIAFTEIGESERCKGTITLEVIP